MTNKKSFSEYNFSKIPKFFSKIFNHMRRHMSLDFSYKTVTRFIKQKMLSDLWQSRYDDFGSFFWDFFLGNFIFMNHYGKIIVGQFYFIASLCNNFFLFDACDLVTSLMYLPKCVSHGRPPWKQSGIFFSLNLMLIKHC